MTKCPRCFQWIPPDLSSWTLRNPRATSLDEIASTYRGHAVHMGEVKSWRNNADAPPAQRPAPHEVAQQLGGPVVEVCPRCHYRLPEHWREGRAVCLAMAGARFTGKTVFIAVLIKQLEKLHERFGHEVIPANEETARRYRAEYEKPLFEERGILPATQPARVEGAHQHEPLIFTLGVFDGIRHFLVIRDVAGEDLEDPAVGGPPWEFFAAADAVLFLFDPMRVEEVRDQLCDLIPTAQSTGGDPREVLRTVMRLIGQGNPKLAVILSKFDTLQALRKVSNSSWGQIMSSAGAAFSRDPGLVDERYNDADGRLLDAEVRSLLQKLDAGPMLRTMTNPITGRNYDHRFFAVSALGESPEGQTLHANGICPFRCMDPVRWVLAEQHSG